jgi:hypothetical protein
MGRVDVAVREGNEHISVVFGDELSILGEDYRTVPTQGRRRYCPDRIEVSANATADGRGVTERAHSGLVRIDTLRRQ